jgi:hypothetical protein
MNTHKVSEIFVGTGGALSTAYNTITAGQLGIFGNSMSATAAGNTISTAGQDSINLVTGVADGSSALAIKKSMAIKGSGITSFQAASFQPAKRCVWSIGAIRGGAGTIAVANSTYYEFVIRFKNDKTLYSVRPEILRIGFTSSATASQSNIADQIVSAINSSSFGTGPNAQIKAVKVGDGTVNATSLANSFGTSGNTDFGVEIWGLDVNQFANTTYTENKVYFSVHIDDSTGFGSSTTATEVQAMDLGIGTYQQIYNLENFDYQYEGALNRRLWPIPALSLNTSSAGIISGAVGTLAVRVFTGGDLIEATTSSFSAAGIQVGQLIALSGDSYVTYYEVKYFVSSTLAVVTEVSTVTATAQSVKAKCFYDVINIEYQTLVVTPGANVGEFALKSITIATPAIDAGETNLANMSTEGAALVAILNPWMSSTPLAPATIAI